MKTQEILLAAALIAMVSGAGAALATGAFQKSPGRSAPEARGMTSAEGESAGTGTSDTIGETRHALDELRLENASLQDRLASLEARLAESQSSRTPVLTLSADTPEMAAPLASDGGMRAATMLDVTPEFVASVDQALDKIKAREDAERELRRKEQQAQRVEERVTKLQAELGLNNRQSSDLRTTLIAQDDKREALFNSMRDGEPRDMRESMRTLRDETHTALQSFLTPAQFEAYQKSEESEWGRRGPGGGGDFGGGRPPEGGSSRPGR
jgi:septal ring factor EnvC (AmiA/AmiB activator)